MDLIGYFSRKQTVPERASGADEDLVDRLRLRQLETVVWEAAQRCERYRSVADYDPVLRWHCRIPKDECNP